MNVKLIMTVLLMSFGTYTYSAQLQSQLPVKKDASIIKSVAASLKEQEELYPSNKYTTLDQLIKTNQQNSGNTMSKEESRALASISPKQNLFISRGKKISDFFQSLFGG